MAEKKIAECCGKLLSHTKAGAPYKHVCGTTVSVATDRTVQDVADRAGLLTAPPAEGVKETEFPPAFWQAVREGLSESYPNPQFWTTGMVVSLADAWGVRINEVTADYVLNRLRDAVTGASHEHSRGLDGSPCPCGTDMAGYTREQLLETLRGGLRGGALLASTVSAEEAQGIYSRAGMKVARATASAMLELLAAEEGHVHAYGRVHAPGEPQHGDMVCECGEKQPETPHVHVYQYGDDDNGHSGSYCECGEEEPEAMAAPAPVAIVLKKGPYFPARFPGLCEACGGEFGEGDSIRADGEGGYECEDHEDEEPEAPAAPPAFVRPTFATVPRHDPEPVVEKPRLLDQLREQQAQRAKFTQAVSSGAVNASLTGGVAGADPWSAPAAVQAFGGETFALPAGMETLPPVNGQPDTKRDQWGRYLIKSPITGDFNRTAKGRETGWTRATTLAKVLSDTFALENWAKRCVVAGMARKPELVATAQGLEVKRDSQKLDQIAEEAKELGGGSRGSKNGTLLHKLTERMDAGVWAPEGADLPEDVRGPVVAYREAMRRAGFTTRPEWIERITWTDLHGEPTGGTTDRILIGPDGRARIGDVKSAKSLDFDGQWMEIAIQMWLYAVGINQHGVYDLNTGTWDTSVPRVSTTEAIVMHMPIERPAGQPAYCNIYRVSLIGIDKVAAACARARAWRKVKGISSLFVGASPEWTSEFATAVSKRDLSRLYAQAREAGVPPQELAALVGVGQRRLGELGLS